MSTASEIVKAIGGPENIANLTHCATRLRFELNDASKVDDANVEAIKGVMGVVSQSGNRYQIIIGGSVGNVFREINALPEMANVGEQTGVQVKAAARAKARGKFAWLDSFFEYLSDSFRPLLGVLLGASLIIAFAAVLDAFHVVDFRSPTKAAGWVFVDAAWRSVFYFLPIMVAYNAAKKLDIDPWLGATVMGALMTPEFISLSTKVYQKTPYVEGGTENPLFVELQKFSDTVCHTNPVLGTESCVARIFGLPIPLHGYGAQVFVPLIMVAVLAVIYKFLKKIITENLQMIFVPFLSMIVMIPVTAFFIGPLGIWLGNGIGGGLAWLNTTAPIVFAVAIPLLYPFLVPLGLHWPLNALMLINIQVLGYDFIQGPMGAWNFACFGATAGVLFLAIKDKEIQMRQTASGALAAGLFGGISEPSLYGIHLRYKRIYPLMLIGCLCGGLTIGILGMSSGGVKTGAFAFASLLTIPVFSPVWVYITAICVAFFTAMILVIILDYRTPEQKAAAKAEAKVSQTVAAQPAVDDAPATSQTKQWFAGLGGLANVVLVDPVADTRIRVEVKDSSLVNSKALTEAGLAAIVQVAPNVWHLIAGLDAEQLATVMKRQLLVSA